jgi:diguanylate cyclase (GGDEF)-like protein
MEAPRSTAHDWASTLGALMDAAAAVLTADSLQETLGCVAEELGGLVPFDDLAIYEVDRGSSLFVPLFAHGSYTAEVMAFSFPLEQGITGATFRTGRAHNVPRTDLDPEAGIVAGTEAAPEAMMSVPLNVAARTIAMLNVYRQGEDAAFSDYEASVIEHFGIIVALALDSARQRELLRSQAERDDLTGLLNRRAFHQQLDALVHEARRSSRPLGLVVIDVDHFKQVNDQHGHQAGDAALVAVADALGDSVRECDVVARVGGEEFALLLPDTEPDAGLAIADRARHRVASQTQLDVRLTLSAGLATYPGDGADAAALLHAADAALYDAKRAGRNRAQAYGGGAVEPSARSRRLQSSRRQSDRALPL